MSNAGDQDSLASTPSDVERLLLWSGIIYSATMFCGMLYVGAAILPHIPPPGSLPTERAAGYVQVADRLQVGNYLMTFPSMFWLFFLGGLYTVLRRSNGESRSLAVAALAGGIAMAMLWPLGSIMSDIALEIAKGGGDAATVSGLDAIAPFTLALSALPRTVMLVATSIILLQKNLAARWIAWTGFIVAVLSFIGSAMLVWAGLFPLLALSIFLFVLWILVLSIALL
jgi:hypothetical protein